MMRTPRRFLAGTLLLVMVGCTAYDETAAQSEFERLRTYPVAPQADHILPDHGSGVAGSEGHQFSLGDPKSASATSWSATLRTGKAPRR